MYNFIYPMLLETAPDPFDDKRYVFQPKIDGHRAIITRHNGETHIFTRHDNEVTRLYPELWDVPVIEDVVLDGEIACHDEDGAIDFERMQTRFAVKNTDKIAAAMRHNPVTFYAFDILDLNGRDLRKLPLYERQRILADVYGGSKAFRSVLTIEGTGKGLFDVIKERNMEGIVAKRKESVYVSERSPNWLKIINWTYVDVYITGWRKQQFGWLAAVHSDAGTLRPAGVIELGVPPVAKKAFRGVVGQLITGEDNTNVYVEPRIRARVRMRNWTKAGMLRAPSFVEFIV
ncbi:ATP-dependent DNA ligase [Paenibacillus sp. sptzw28]|uniref:ATP-dependent DNA ligase n=1 Tax=Paenibacillus sp. sptzw28 TaxID=715179 RepID=UPI001C6EF34C|nr:RNA ligase family protein [Paenibacillus sp. sptzw28]QYR22289.1 ATP-dependent DNA ligase [Paenibacillus sp. sptzw28]